MNVCYKRVFLFGFLMLAAGVPSYAGSYSNETMKGSFGYTVTGTVVSANGFAPGPFAAVGRITFDGSGNVQTIRSLSDNGAIIQSDTGTGAYSLGSDCTSHFVAKSRPAAILFT